MKLWAIIPELIIAGLSLFLIPVAGWVKGRKQVLPAYISVAGLIAALWFTFRMLDWVPFDIFEGTYAIDKFGNIFKMIIISGSIITILLLTYFFKKKSHIAHAPIAVLFATLGAVGVSSSLDLGLIVIFLQMMSLASYILVGLIRKNPLANEAAIKYFIYAAAALSIMAFGLTFLYGLTGSLDIRVIGEAVNGEKSVWITIALSMILIGFGFEVTMVPFHFWAPDIYSGSTSPVAGFLSVVPKAAGFAGIIRILLTAFPSNTSEWHLIIAILSAITMTYGNLIALTQNNLKRLLAYSSISQSGYILMAVSFTETINDALPATGFYIFAYMFMNLGAFAVVSQLERNFGSDDRLVFHGLFKLSPFSSIVMTISLLSLAGIPPLAGFAGKVFLLKPVINAGFTWLAVVAVVNMTIALFYYVSIIADMFMKNKLIDDKPLGGVSYIISLILCFAGSILLGVFPSIGLDVTELMSFILK